MLILSLFSVFQEGGPDDVGWHDLVAKGFIEYIDTEEEETTMISMTINVRGLIFQNKHVVEHLSDTQFKLPNVCFRTLCKHGLTLRRHILKLTPTVKSIHH